MQTKDKIKKSLLALAAAPFDLNIDYAVPIPLYGTRTPTTEILWNKILTIGLAGFFIILVIVLGIYLFIKRRKKKQELMQKIDNLEKEVTDLKKQ